MFCFNFWIFVDLTFYCMELIKGHISEMLIKGHISVFVCVQVCMMQQYSVKSCVSHPNTHRATHTHTHILHTNTVHKVQLEKTLFESY